MSTADIAELIIPFKWKTAFTGESVGVGCGNVRRHRRFHTNRVRRQSGFPTFIMTQRHYVRTSAKRYGCGDNRTKVKTLWLQHGMTGGTLARILAHIWFADLLADGEPYWQGWQNQRGQLQCWFVVDCEGKSYRSFQRSRQEFSPEGTVVTRIRFASTDRRDTLKM